MDEPELQRFPGYDVVAQAGHWDSETRAVVLGRLRPRRETSFFSETEERAARPLLDRLLANDDRPDKVPVFEMVDQRLAEGSTDGWHYDDMPEDAEAWRRTLAELNRLDFAALSSQQQHDLLETVREGECFAGLPAGKVWNLWLRYACTAYYSHPWAFNEVGFGGPAYPRGYKNVGVGKREPWEVEEVDAADPLPWVQWVEVARRRHVARGSRL
ncbi:MAG TPA: gluconate 2-dehydrogenase subunit 3 family protein [Actinomycetota bacterium]